MDPHQRESVQQSYEQLSKVKDNLFQQSQPVFQSYDESKRNFPLTLAAISSTIGAFSFILIGNKNISSPIFLQIGDILLIIAIISSLIYYVYLYQSQLETFHKTYYDLTGKANTYINKQLAALRREISFEELQKFYESEKTKSVPQERPKPPGSYLDYFTVSLTVIALLFVAMAFLPVNINFFHVLGSIASDSLLIRFLILFL